MDFNLTIILAILLISNQQCSAERSMTKRSPIELYPGSNLHINGLNHYQNQATSELHNLLMGHIQIPEFSTSHYLTSKENIINLQYPISLPVKMTKIFSYPVRIVDVLKGVQFATPAGQIDPSWKYHKQFLSTNNKIAPSSVDLVTKSLDFPANGNNNLNDFPDQQQSGVGQKQSDAVKPVYEDIQHQTHQNIDNKFDYINYLYNPQQLYSLRRRG